MKLSEVIKRPQQFSHGLDLTKFDGAVQFKKAKVEKFPLLYRQEGDDYFFTFEVKGKKVAFMKAVKITDLPGETLMIKRTWVTPENRNKGLMTALYRTLYHQRFKLISDLDLSPESFSIWKKLSKGEQVKILNQVTKKIRPVTNDDFNPKGEEAMLDHFILEDMTGWEHGWGPEVDNFTVEDLNVYIKHDKL